MDSITQIVLGAGVAAAVAGPRVGPRRAAIIGAVLGTLPDLDVFVPLGDPVADFVEHRGPSHSLIIQALATPLIAEGLRWMIADLRDRRVLVYLTVYLCLATHALLDAMTIYGTHLFWPVMAEPVGLGSMFIIDPLYTIPLLVVMVWALCIGQWTARFARGLTVALVVSSAYLGWSAVAQRIAEARGEGVLAELGASPDRVIATPTPFNTLFWLVLAVEHDRYLRVYTPLLGGREAMTAYAFPRGGNLVACAERVEKARDLMAFTKGFFKLEDRGGRLRVTDLRMGLEPDYVFTFDVAELSGGEAQAIHPVRWPVKREAGRDIDWLFAGLQGERAVRQAEADALISADRPTGAGPTVRSASACCPG